MLIAENIAKKFAELFLELAKKNRRVSPSIYWKPPRYTWIL